MKAVRAATGGREATPEGVAMVAGVKADLMARARETIDRELLVPAGGMEMADRNPGWPAECEVGREAFRKRMFVGRMLVLVRTLDMHHGGDPRLAPSLKRALAIMQGEKKAERYGVPSAKTLLAWWAEARGIAPLCAATFLMLGRQDPEADGFAAPLATAEGMATILGTAKGLREWATGFKHPLAPNALVLEKEAAVYDADVPTLHPVLRPLDDVQRKAARGYRA